MPSFWDTWGPWIQLGAQAGSGIMAGRSANNAINQQNEQVAAGQNRLYDMAEREEKRREAMLNIFMPMLLRDARFKNPQILGQFLPRRLGQNQPPPQTQTFAPDLADAPYPYNPGPSPIPPNQDNPVPDWWDLT